MSGAANTANIIRYFLTQALNFAFRDTYRSIFAFTRWWMLGNLASGAAAGVTSLLFVYPLDYVRTRLASDVKNAASRERQFKGLVDVFEKTLASDGVAGLYRGFLPSVIGIVIYRGLYFAIYDSVRPFVTGSLEGNLFATFLLGWTITTTASLASYPLDTIRSRMMMGSGEVNYEMTHLRLERSNTDVHTPDYEVQVFPRCWRPDPCSGGLHISLEGCWCRYSPWR